jgi:hypothetical protein
MADNFNFTPGSGGTGAADDIGGVLYPRVKVTYGADGSATDVSTSSPMPSQLRDSDGTDVALSAKLGSVTETAPTTDTASSGLNGRLQRIAQRITSLIALIPAALTGSGNFKVSLEESNASQAVTGSFYQATQPVSVADGSNVTLGAKTDAQSTATDTTSITIMQVLKQISASIQAAASSLSGTLTVGSHAVTNAGTFPVQSVSAGDVANDGADSGNPVKVGGKAVSSEPSAVANADRSNLHTDLVGKLLTIPYSVPELLVTGSNASAITNTTSTSIIAAQGAGIRSYVTSLIVTNSHATVGTLVKITDGSGGTLLAQGYCAALGGGFTLTLNSPIKTTANTALHAICGTTGANVYVSAIGYKGV